MAKCIAIIFHEKERIRTARKYAIWHLAEIWKRENIGIIYLFGIEKFIPADLAILHVDLSVVPERYLDFANRYPLVLNGEVKDIRKSSFSENIVTFQDDYKGPVIVKSNLNFAGQPERKFTGSFISRFGLHVAARLPARRKRSGTSRPRFRLPNDYLIFDSADSVPGEWFDLNDVLIERFLPEMQEGNYCQRVYHFLGNCGVCYFRRSKEPIVNPSQLVDRQVVDVHPGIEAKIKHMKFDYGKFDYVMYESRPVLLDANKTPGAADNPIFFAMCEEWAKGIQSYL